MDSMPRLKPIFFLLLALACLPGALRAVPPFPGIKSDLPTCKVNPVSMGDKAKALLLAPYFPTPLSPTTSYVLVMRVDFSDKASVKTKADAEQFFDQV